VLPVAVLWGIGLATLVSVASMLAFNWFFLPPTHTLQLSDGANWLARARVPRDGDRRERARGACPPAGRARGAT